MIVEWLVVKTTLALLMHHKTMNVRLIRATNIEIRLFLLLVQE